MKCADIDDDVFLAAVAATTPMHPGRSVWRFRGAVKATLDGMLGQPIPERLFLAKARKLGLKGRLMGCTSCTCRGDYHLRSECLERRCCGLEPKPGERQEVEADESRFHQMVREIIDAAFPPSSPFLAGRPREKP